MRAFLFFIVIIVFCLNSKASLIILNGVGSTSSKQGTVSLQALGENMITGLDIGFSVDAGRSQNQMNFNPATSDINIEKITYAGGVDFSWRKFIGLYVHASNENINNSEVRSNGILSKIKLFYKDFNLSFGLNDLYVRQKKDYYVVNTEIKSQLTLKNQQQSLTMAYSGFNDLYFSITHSQFKYDTNIQNFNTLLSITNLLNRNGAAFLSQVTDLIDHETVLDVTYRATDDLDLELSLADAINYLEPKTKSNTLRTGATYFFDQFSLGLGLSNLKMSDSSTVSTSIDSTFSLLF
jgi:hypothetical protein